MFVNYGFNNFIPFVMSLKASNYNFKLLFFSIIASIIAYGFALTNFSLSIDSESPIFSDFSLALGRWGTNLIRYYIFGGHLPYFTLLLSLILLSFTAVELSKLFKLQGSLMYVFCLLFLTFPQLSYQLVFTMQADVVAIGFLLSVATVVLFIRSTENMFSIKSILLLISASLVFMFVIASYQALLFIPIIIYLIHFFQNTYLEGFNLKKEFIKLLYFGGLVIFSFGLYFISVKLFCPAVEEGYLSSYVSGESNNQFLDFCSLWATNLVGNFYYGEKTFMVATLLSVFLFVRFFIEKTQVLIRFGILFILLLLPFIMSYFITNGYHPPRIYVTSGLVYAFIIVHAAGYYKRESILIFICSFICLANIYFITKLFYSNYQISNHDKVIAKKIDASILSQYPDFDPNVNYVYFFGCLPYEHHQNFRIDKSEVFGGSLFNWDNGSNYRIINLFKYQDIANYKMIDNKEIYLRIKDSIGSMPIWPKKESVKMINNVVVVKLGNNKGSPLWVE